MVKKLEELAEEKTEGQLMSSVLESANQIWLAGLGAFAKAQEEGVKIFDALVKEGESVQRQTRKVAGERMEEATNRASETWDKIEHVFESRVAKALHSLNVPSRKDIDTLNHRVAELTEAVERLAGTEKPAKPARAAHAGKAEAEHSH